MNALDLNTEVKIIESIKNLSKTVIIISHRMSTLDQCNEIYELKDKALILYKKINNVERKSFLVPTPIRSTYPKNYEGTIIFLGNKRL